MASDPKDVSAGRRPRGSGQSEDAGSRGAAGSPSARFWTTFRKSKMGMAGLVILLFFFLVAIFAPLLADQERAWTRRRSTDRRWRRPPGSTRWGPTTSAGRC